MLTKQKSKIIYVVIAIMTTISVIWLSYEFWRLLWQTGEWGAVDLRLRYKEVTAFFEGIPVYKEIGHAVYPPATYIILWPFLGWLSEANVRVFWALTTVIFLIVLICQMLYESRSKILPQKVFWALLPLSMYATGATIGNGQLAVHIIPCLLGCFFLLQKHKRSWSQNFLAAILMIFALVKPTISIPFFWIFVVKSLPAAFLVTVEYILLTVFASLFQPGYGPVELFGAWLTMGEQGASFGATKGEGSLITNISAHSILGAFDLSDWNRFVSSAILLILGIWIYQNKHRDIWILASVAAIVSKFWIYHGWYDDLILLLPMITLLKISVQFTFNQRQRYFGKLLFTAMFLFTLAPGGIYLFPEPWNFVYLILQTIILCTVLLFLIVQLPGVQDKSGNCLVETSNN